LAFVLETIVFIDSQQEVVDIHALVYVEVESESLIRSEGVDVHFLEFAGSHQVSFEFCGFQNEVSIKNAALAIGIWDYRLLVDLGNFDNQLLGDLSSIMHLGIPSSIKVSSDIMLIKAEPVQIKMTKLSLSFYVLDYMFV